MSRIAGIALRGVRSAARRLKERAVRDIVLDARDGKQWAEDNIPRMIALVVEKWLGFWLTFWFAISIGWAGLMLIEGVRWASDVQIVISTAPWVVSQIGTLGFIIVLLSGIAILGIVAISVGRVLLWVRDATKKYWKKHTPRHADMDTESETLPWPPSEKEMDRAQARLWKFANIGSILFLIIMPTLLWLELNYPNQLHAIVSSPELSSVGDVVNAAIWLISIEGLFGTVSASVSQAWVIYFILIFVLPGIFIAIAARNLLFLTEAIARTEIEKVAEGSILSWTGLKLTGLVLFFSLWTVGILYQVFAGL